MEEWRDIIGFPGYQVSSLGNVRLGRKIITPSENNRGTIRVNLRLNGKPYTRSLCRLVCQAFHGEPEQGDNVVYLDGDQTNLRADNLYWGTRSFAWEWTHQMQRTVPLRKSKVHRIATGEIFANSLEAAKAVNGIEKYIVVCCGDTLTRFYRGSNWEFWFD